MQQYKVNDKVFKNITEASAYVTTLNKAVTITPNKGNVGMGRGVCTGNVT